MSGRVHFASAVVSLLAIASCAQVLGIEDSTSSIEDLCSCDQLKDAALNARCRALVNQHSGDDAFIRSFVKAGCPTCPMVSQCLKLLGASDDGATCSSDPDCASTHCCTGKCCSGCHGCTGPSPHCTPLFDQASTCLMNAHGALCPSCSTTGPLLVGDACWNCLVGMEMSTQKCETEIAACTAEGP
jgi:hypothetical protein